MNGPTCEGINCPPNTEKSPSFSVEGFSKRQKKWINDLVKVTNLPNSGFDRISKSKSTRIVHFPFFESGRFTPHSRDIQLSDVGIGINAVLEPRSLFRLTEDIGGILLHEIGHSMGSYSTGREQWAKNFPSVNERLHQKINAAIVMVTDQAYRTGVPLNGYHGSYLSAARALKAAHGAGFISKSHYLRKIEQAYAETEAILIEMRYNAPEVLKAVNEKQHELFQGAADKEGPITWDKYPEKPLPLFAIANDLISFLSGMTEKEIDASVQAYQRFIKEKPFPLL